MSFILRSPHSNVSGVAVLISGDRDHDIENMPIHGTPGNEVVFGPYQRGRMSTPRPPTANLGMASAPGPNNGLLVQKVDRNGSVAGGGVLVGDEVVAINGKPTPKAE